MIRMNNRKPEMFDFSLDAKDFKARLWKQLQEAGASSKVSMLEDDDLEWVNAAGMTRPDEKDDKLPE